MSQAVWNSALVVATGCLAGLAALGVGGALRTRLRVLASLPLRLPMIGFALLYSSGLAAAQERHLSPLERTPRHAPPPPWSRTDGFSPPQPSVRTEALDFLVVATGGGDHHPAAHAVSPRTVGGRLLFPREGSRFSDRRGQEQGALAGGGPPAPGGHRGALRYPSKPGSGWIREGSRPRWNGNGERSGHHDTIENGPEAKHDDGASRGPGSASGGDSPTHVVRSGDTLWSIAAAVLKTTDVARIARYWPRIHRANRVLIGRDPNLIIPGQLLHLPAESDS